MCDDILIFDSCNGEGDGEIDITVDGGVKDLTGDYTYAWTGIDNDGDPIDLIGQENQQDLTNLGPGMYSVLVTDDNECPISIIDIEIIVHHI